MIKSAILQLYKHHYIETHESLTTGQYSCWGNYDRMSLLAVTHQNNTLITSRDSLGLTDMWYQLSGIIGSQDGAYSQQCIGLIYEGTQENTLTSFLTPDEYFCCACLLKLKNSYQTNVYNKLKQYSREFVDNESYVNSLFFRTIDNADAVILIKGNSYKKIVEQVLSISKDNPEILYTYSICGVNQEYLDNVNWNGAKHPLLNDPIQQITSRIIAKPSVDTKDLENRIGGSGEWAWVFGNTDILWNMNSQGLTINQAIDLMRPNIDEKSKAANPVINSLPPLFGNEIYGSTTEIIPEFYKYPATKKKMNSPYFQTTHEEQWCRKRIKELKNRLQQSHDEKNDMLYSYYLALIQSLTMIVPYEESSFAKDIFYIVFPSLLMFHKQLDTALSEAQNNSVSYRKMGGRWDVLIKNLASYLDMLDQIIYRSIHSEQTFFMVPGYCGALYTILPKLSMMYMALLYAGIDALQEQAGVYECCLYPVVDSKPCTTEVDFRLQPAERLIEIKISQRSMFSANLMPILLLHELSHYIGKSRNRPYRAYCMIQTWGEVLTELLLGDHEELTNTFQEECLDLIYEENKNDVWMYITKELEVRMKKGALQEEAYFDDFFDELVCHSKEILEDTDSILRSTLQRKGPKLKEKICENRDSKDFTKRICEVENLYSILKNKMSGILTNERTERLEANMKICFKETFADIIALYLIGFQSAPRLFERYLEAFYLSEGVNFEISDISIELINRVAVTATVLPKLDSNAKKNWNKLINNRITKYNKQKNKMNSIDYLILHAHIYQLLMEKGDNAITGKILNEIRRLEPVESKESIAKLEMTWTSQMNYLNEVVEDLKQTGVSGNGSKERIQKLYSLLDTPAQDTANDLSAFDDIILWYKGIVDRKKNDNL